MDIQLEKQSEAYGVLKVKVTEADYHPEFNKQLKAYGKKVNLKGFRPGKVPASLIKKMYGKELLQEVFNKAVSENLQKYLKENEVKHLFYPYYKGEPVTPEELQGGIEELNLEFEMCLTPEFSYELNKKQKVKSYDLEISDADVEKTVNKLKESYPKVSQVEEIAEEDYVKGVFKQVDGEFEKDTLLPIATMVKEEAKEQFVGKKKGEKIEFTLEEVIIDAGKVKNLFGIELEEAENLKGKFELEVTEITRNEPAQLDQDFFDMVLGKDVAKDETEFTEKLKEQLKKNNENGLESLLNKRIREKLLNKIEFELPEELLKKFLKDSFKEESTEEQVEEQYPKFLEEVKWNVISTRLFDDAELKVEEADIRSKAKELIQSSFMGYGMAQQFDDEMLDGFVDNYLRHENGKNYEQVYNTIFNEKIAEYVSGKIKVEKESVDLEKLEEVFKEEFGQN
ncbi:trigger factor [Rapidithrix thailandica]|uniref:Trigger factor n=1 Tax=Rapidithrix thailandica TaxID=413964 RepID=A0AAW9RUU4_9BACT